MICKHIDQRRCRPEVWTLLEGGEFLPIVTNAGIRVHCLMRGWAYSPLFALRAARAIARTSFDLIHCFSHASAPNAALAKSMFRLTTPMVYSEGTSVSQDGARGRVDKWSVNQFSSFVANSTASKNKLTRLMGIAESRVSIIPNGQELERFQSRTSRCLVRERLGIEPERTVLLVVGRLIPTKRICDLLGALDRLRSHAIEPLLLIVGDGPERPALEEQSRRLGLIEKVRFLGQRDDVPDLLGAADLFVFPSEVEGLPNVVIEAALCSLPVVACDIPGVRDIVGHDHEPYLVPCRSPEALANAIARALEEPDKMRWRAEGICQRVNTKFTISSVLQRLYTVYEELLDD